MTNFELVFVEEGHLLVATTFRDKSDIPNPSYPEFQ